MGEMIRGLIPLEQGSEGIRRKMEEMRAQLEQSEQFQQGESRCPAGEYVSMTRDGSPGCRCRVERETITMRSSPTSLVDFCFGDHQSCPTWRAEKKRIEEQRRTPLADISTYRERRELIPIPDGDGVLAMKGNRAGRDEEAQDL